MTFWAKQSGSLIMCQSADNLDPLSASKNGSDSNLLQLRRSPILGRFNEPGPEQIDVRPTIHLALEGLEVVKLSLGLPVRPWFPQGCGDRSLISPKPAGEGVEQTLLRLIHYPAIAWEVI